MVPGMATTKITITLPDEQIQSIRELVAAGKAESLSGFVKHAVEVGLFDMAGCEERRPKAYATRMSKQVEGGYRTGDTHLRSGRLSGGKSFDFSEDERLAAGYLYLPVDLLVLNDPKRKILNRMLWCELYTERQELARTQAQIAHSLLQIVPLEPALAQVLEAE